MENLLPGVEWVIDLAHIPESELVTTPRASALRFLELLRKMVTGRRALSTPTVTNNQERKIVEGLALDVYLDRHEVSEEVWVVAPQRFF
jgi:hypothetical protein